MESIRTYLFYKLTVIQKKKRNFYLQTTVGKMAVTFISDKQLGSRSNFHSQGHNKLLPIEQKLFDLQTSNLIYIIVKQSSFTLTLTQGQIMILKVTTNFCL